MCHAFVDEPPNALFGIFHHSTISAHVAAWQNAEACPDNSVEAGFGKHIGHAAIEGSVRSSGHCPRVLDQLIEQSPERNGPSIRIGYAPDANRHRCHIVDLNPFEKGVWRTHGLVVSGYHEKVLVYLSASKQVSNVVLQPRHP